MMRTVICSALLLWFIISATDVLAGEGIVVWRLDKKSGVTSNDIDSISGLVTAHVQKASQKKVISEAEIGTILKGEEKRQQCGADNSSCIVEIGAALGAPEAVSGDLGKVGSYWMLNLRRISTRDASVISRCNRSIRGTIDNVIEAIPAAVAELFGVKAPETSAAAEPEQEKAPAKSDSRKQRSIYVFVKGIMLPVAKADVEFSANGRTYDMGGDYDFSGGVGLAIDGNLTPWLAFGGEFDYMIMIADGGSVDEHLGIINIDPTLRFFYQYKILQIYLKLAFGPSVVIPPDKVDGSDNPVDIGGGWNTQILPGLMLAGKHVGFFLEPGGYFAGLYPDGGSSGINDVKMIEKMFMLNVGLVFIGNP